MDSSLILHCVEVTILNAKSLWSDDRELVQRECRIVSLVLAACEKGVQSVYERKIRHRSYRVVTADLILRSEQPKNEYTRSIY